MYEKICSKENLIKAFQNATKGKTKKTYDFLEEVTKKY